MSLDKKTPRSVLLFEGQARWIMERETPEERIAALEVLMAIAFPNEGEEYKPPKSPKTNIGKVQRDAYNIFKDFSESRMWEWPGENQKKIVSEAHGTRIQSTEPMFAYHYHLIYYLLTLLRRRQKQKECMKHLLSRKRT